MLRRRMKTKGLLSTMSFFCLLAGNSVWPGNSVGPGNAGFGAGGLLAAVWAGNTLGDAGVDVSVTGSDRSLIGQFPQAL